jgi:hypothetical protein
MADWNTPTLTTTYAAFLAAMQERDVDAATMAESPTNPPVNYIRWNTALSKLQRWNGAAWVDLVLSGAGGGTGGTTPLGTMSTQNANAVAITGGTLAGITSFTMAGNILPDVDGSRVIGSAALMFKGAYFKDYLVVPVGADKWAP